MSDFALGTEIIAEGVKAPLQVYCHFMPVYAGAGCHWAQALYCATEYCFLYIVPYGTAHFCASRHTVPHISVRLPYYRYRL